MIFYTTANYFAYLFPSDLVRAPRIAECPVQLEALVQKIHTFEEEDDHTLAIEAHIIRVHVDESIIMDGEKNYIDPQKWQPLIMNFCEFFGLSKKLHPSRLAPLYGPVRLVAEDA